MKIDNTDALMHIFYLLQLLIIARCDYIGPKIVANIIAPDPLSGDAHFLFITIVV